MKKIELTRGYYAIVDDEDYDILIKYKWHSIIGRNTIYASRTFSRGNNMAMHRFLMNVTDKDMYVDHIDGNGLNNSRSNLRVCTRSQNLMNRGKQKNNTSGYVGVTKHRDRNGYGAYIRVDNQMIWVGRKIIYAVDAAVLYDIAAEKYHKEFAKLNFPRASSESTYLCAHEIRTFPGAKHSVDSTASSKAGALCLDCEWDGSFKRFGF